MATKKTEDEVKNEDTPTENPPPPTAEPSDDGVIVNDNALTENQQKLDATPDTQTPTGAETGAPQGEDAVVKEDEQDAKVVVKDGWLTTADNQHINLDNVEYTDVPVIAHRKTYLSVHFNSGNTLNIPSADPEALQQKFIKAKK